MKFFKALFLVHFLLIGGSIISQVNLDSLWSVWNDTTQADTNRLKAIHKIAWDGYLFSKTDSPSDPDLKQMFVYNLHYNSKLSILLYPKTVLNSSLKKPFINHNFKKLFCQAAFVEIFNENQKLDSLLGHKIYNVLIKDELLRA